MPTLQRLDPAKEVQPLVMLTGGGHGGVAPALGPNPAQLGMNRKAALVGKDQKGFLFLLYNPLEFFLRPRRNRATPLGLA